MSFIADREQDFNLWDYITGDISEDLSIARDRYYFLDELARSDNFKIALRDPSNNYWSKWVGFPGPLWETKRGKFGFINISRLTAAIDVHRGILENEIVIESDYPTYEENYEAAKLIGKILESKGFIPHYYYSGNKSVHIHIFFNWNCLGDADIITQDILKKMFNGSKLSFKKKFITWLRTKMISCWDTNAKEFDTDLINATHLIRCELSKNKLGYKTFLGYSYKDMSFIPYICNESNRIYPKLGKIKLSNPKEINKLVEEFIEDIRVKTKKEIQMKKNRSLTNWGVSETPIGLRECAKLILSEDFKKANDGFKRGMFILLNELRRAMGDSQARILINDWNRRMDLPIKDNEIEYRFKKKTYSLTCSYIHKFLKEVGLDVSEKCKGKL